MSDFIGYLLIFLVLFWIGKTMLTGFREGSKPNKKFQLGQRAPESKVNQGGDATGSGHDGWEGAFWEARQNLGLSALIRLKYRDVAGNESQRDVQVRAFDPTTPTSLFMGHCRWRDATRTFRFDRVISATDLETGEVISDLRFWFLGRYKATPRGVADQLLADHFDQLLVLLYVAKADGRMMASEIEVIARFCNQAAGGDAITADIVKKALRQLDEPTFTGFKSAFDRVKNKSGALAGTLLSSAEGVVSTQKNVHENELKALQWMRECLGVKPAE